MNDTMKNFENKNGQQEKKEDRMRITAQFLSTHTMNNFMSSSSDVSLDSTDQEDFTELSKALNLDHKFEMVMSGK